MATTNKFDFGKIVKALNQSKRDVPVLVANDARKFFVRTFKDQGFQQEITLDTWKEVQRRIPGTDAYKYPKKKKLSRRTSPILVRTGKLRREVNNSVRYANWNQIKLGVSDATPYAEYHNEGTDKIPRRKFMGNSGRLTKQIKNRLQTELRKVFPK